MKKVITALLIIAVLATIAGIAVAEMNIKWTTGSNHPSYRKGGVLALFEGSPYSIAGMEYPWAESADSYSYSISSNQWSDAVDMPVGRAYTQGIDVGDAVYVCGGRKTDSIKYSKAECYKMYKSGGNITWTQISSLIEDAAIVAIGKVGTKIIVAGGTQFYSGMQTEFHDVIDRVQYYDTAYPNNGWNNYATIPTHARAGSAGCGLGSYFYLFGGCYWADTGGDGSYIRMLDSHKLNTSTNTWSNIADLPAGVSNIVAVPYDDRFIILIGGGDGEDNNEDVWVYDTSANTYQTQPNPLPYPAGDVRASIINNKIYAVGGELDDPDHSRTDNHLRIGTITFPSISFLDDDGNVDRSYDKKCPDWTAASFFCNPEGAWQGWTFNSGSNSCKPIGVGDYNKDGYDDLFVIQSSGEIKCLVFGYSGPGILDLLTIGNPKSAWGWPFSSGDNGTVPLGVGDYNGDGIADIFIIEEDGDIRVLTLNGETDGSGIAGLYDIGNPKNAWGWGFSSDPDETGYDAIGIADYNKDGKDDIWVLEDNGLVRVLTMNGETDGSGIAGLYDVGNPYSELGWGFRPSNHSVRPVKLCDVNGDGYSDLVTVNASGDVRALKVQSNGTFNWTYVSMSDPYADNRLQADQFTTKPLDIAYGWDWWWN